MLEWCEEVICCFAFLSHVRIQRDHLVFDSLSHLLSLFHHVFFPCIDNMLDFMARFFFSHFRHWNRLGRDAQCKHCDDSDLVIRALVQRRDNLGCKWSIEPWLACMVENSPAEQWAMQPAHYTSVPILWWLQLCSILQYSIQALSKQCMPLKLALFYTFCWSELPNQAHHSSPLFLAPSAVPMCVQHVQVPRHFTGWLTTIHSNSVCRSLAVFTIRCPPFYHQYLVCLSTCGVPLQWGLLHAPFFRFVFGYFL